MTPRYLALMAALGLSAIPLATEAEAAVFNSANGHWYEYVGAQVGFADALAGAAGATPIAGFESHLATVTSTAENAFISSLTPEQAWLAGSDSFAEGFWIWVAGPEAGQPFSFTNWYLGEPDDFLGFEDALVTNFIDVGGWADAPGGLLVGHGYIVEYSPLEGTAPSPAVPEPSTWAMMLLGFAAAGWALRRRGRPRAAGPGTERASA